MRWMKGALATPTMLSVAMNWRPAAEQDTQGKMHTNVSYSNSVKYHRLPPFLHTTPAYIYFLRLVVVQYITATATSRHIPTTCHQHFCDVPLHGPKYLTKWS
jgi:hypothetical protein